MRFYKNVGKDPGGHEVWITWESDESVSFTEGLVLTAKNLVAFFIVIALICLVLLVLNAIVYGLQYIGVYVFGMEF